MGKESKSIWKRSFIGRTALVVWLAVAVLTVMLGCFIIALTNQSQPVFNSFMQWGRVAGGCEKEKKRKREERAREVIRNKARQYRDRRESEARARA